MYNDTLAPVLHGEYHPYKYIENESFCKENRVNQKPP